MSLPLEVARQWSSGTDHGFDKEVACLGHPTSVPCLKWFQSLSRSRDIGEFGQGQRVHGRLLEAVTMPWTTKSGSAWSDRKDET